MDPKQVIKDLIDCLEYVENNFPTTGGWAVRQVRIRTAKEYLRDEEAKEEALRQAERDVSDEWQRDRDQDRTYWQEDAEHFESVTVTGPRGT